MMMMTHGDQTWMINQISQLEHDDDDDDDDDSWGSDLHDKPDQPA
jgi:hypothetical protein